MQAQNKASYSVVVPLFNEEENVVPLVNNILKAVGHEPEFLEIVLVDDGSMDATAQLASEMASEDDRVRLVQHDRNRGLGAAICSGLRAAEGDLVLYTDADLPFDFSLIPQLISKAGDDRVVSGYRLNRGEGPKRWILTKGYNLLIWLFFGLYMRDVNFACKIFPRRFLRKAELNSEGSFIDVEMLLETRRLGLEITECPLIYYPRERGLSTLSRPAVILYIIHEMYRYTAKQISQQTAALEFITISPAAKITALSIIAATSAILLFEGIGFDHSAAWLSLLIEAGFASVFFGWRIGLFAAALPFIGLESWLLLQGQPFLGRENYYPIAWALIGIPFSQLSFGSWKLIQRSLKLTTSE